MEIIWKRDGIINTETRNRIKKENRIYYALNIYEKKQLKKERKIHVCIAKRWWPNITIRE